MLFTAWEISKAPADSERIHKSGIFLLEAKPWLECKFKLQPNGASKIPLLDHRWMGPFSQGSHFRNLLPQKSTDMAPSKPHISLEIFELLREKTPTKFKQSSIMPSLLSTHVIDMVKIKWTNFLLCFPLFLF